MNNSHISVRRTRISETAQNDLKDTATEIARRGYEQDLAVTTAES